MSANQQPWPGATDDRPATPQHKGLMPKADKIKLDALPAALRGSKTWDPPSVAAGAQATTTVTVTGAALGDYVGALSFSLDLAGLALTGYVSAADTVTAVLRNGTAGAVDLASGTLRALVLRQ